MDFENKLLDLCRSLKRLGLLEFRILASDEFAKTFEAYLKNSFSIGSSRFSLSDNNTPTKCMVFGITFIFIK